MSEAEKPELTPGQMAIIISDELWPDPREELIRRVLNIKVGALEELLADPRISGPFTPEVLDRLGSDYPDRVSQIAKDAVHALRESENNSAGSQS